MSTMLYALGRWCFRMRRRVVLVWLGILVLLGGLAGLLHTGFNEEFEIPGTPSQVALDQLYMTFPEVAGTRATMVIVPPEGTTVDSPGFRAFVENELDRLDDLEVVDTVASPYDDLIDGLINDDRSAALVNLTLTVDPVEVTDEELQPLLDIADEIEADLPAGSQVAMGGDAFAVEIPGLSITEVFGVIVALIVLLVTLGSAIAAGMPIVTALWGVGASSLLMLAATGVMTISSTTPILSVMLGLAVGIDYALFILTRHREQLGEGLDAEESAARSLATAGSAIVFAGITCIIALVGLAVARIPFLTVMGVFAAIGVGLAVLIAMTILPAFMGFAGERLRPRAQKSRAQKSRGRRAEDEPSEMPQRAEPKRAGRGFLSTWVHWAITWPWLTVIVIVVALGALSVPGKDLQLSLPNPGQNSIGSPERETYDLTAEKFGPGYNGPLIVTAEIIQSTDPLGLMDDLKREVESVPGVKLVALATPNPNADTGFIQVIPETAPDDPATTELVEHIRELQPRWEEQYGVPTAVTGMTAVQIDISTRLAQALLPFGIFVVGLSLVLLTMVFRSIAIPIKTALGYLLSVGSAFGATVIVFHHGIGMQVINLEQPQAVISFYPILLMGILFGLAMDYEVFLVARMREEYMHGADAESAIRLGFVGSGKVVIATASIMVAVFAFFVPEGMGAIKAIAFGLAIGVTVDAFIVRMTLVPAVMKLLGDKAWWIPKWLDERLPTFDVEGDAMTRMVNLQEWGSGRAVRVEGFAPHTPASGNLCAPIDLDVPHGDVLVVQSDRRRRLPLLYALAGRLRGTVGTAKVLGRLLPEQSAQVRRQVALIDGSTAEDLRADLERALRRHTPMIVIDAADALPTADDRDALADLLAGRLGDDEQPTVVLGVADLDVVEPLITTTYHTIELLSDHHRAAELVTAGGQ